MKFTRFGNAFIAYDEDGFLYVVSYYMGGWHAYMRQDNGTPLEIGQYGYETADKAKNAADTFVALA